MAQLTGREKQIVELVARGLRNAEIAALCGTSCHTVRNQLAIIFTKLDVSTRSELVARAIAEGLLSAFA
jgi:DNA-binding CsgD family transcriptional regulator